MSEEAAKAWPPKWVGPYLRFLADRLGLRDWTIILKHEVADEPDVYAAINPVEDRKLATIRLAEDFTDRTPDEQRHTLIHELLHCHHVPASDMVRLDLTDHLSQTSYDLFYASFRRHIEYMTDGIADSVAPLMPLPAELDKATRNDRWWAKED